jgi:hypothetical protein
MAYSCTITKRHFGSGYHVEWNRRIGKAENTVESLKKESFEASTALKTSDETDSLFIKETEQADPDFSVPILETKEVIEEQKKDATPAKMETAWEEKSRYVRQTPVTKFKTAKNKDSNGTENTKPKLHPFMWVIWGLWSLAIISLLIFVFTSELLAFLLTLGISLFLLGLFSIFVIKSLHKHPEKYGFKGLSYCFTIPSVIIAAIAISLGLLILLLMLLFTFL